MKEKKWDYEELFFQKIDLEPLRQGKPASAFKYSNEEKTEGYVVTIFKSKNGEYYVKVEVAEKISGKKRISGASKNKKKENTLEDVPF